MKLCNFQRDVINLTNLATDSLLSRFIVSRIYRDRNLSVTLTPQKQRLTFEKWSRSFEERLVYTRARKALIDRGIRLLTSNQRRIQLANNAHPRETQSSRLSLSRFAPRHYWMENREKGGGEEGREKEKVSSRGGLLKLRLLLISSSVSSKLHRIRRLPTPLNY